jgi:hypothetical protein
MDWLETARRETFDERIEPIPRSPVVGAVSDAAGAVRRGLNNIQIPVLGGAGDLLVGEAPEEIDRWAHGFHPFKDRNVPGYGGLRIPEIQERRAAPVADALFFGADAAGVGAGAAALGRAGLRSAGRTFADATSEAANLADRRAFLKKGATLAAGATAAATTPDLFKRGFRAMMPDPTTATTRVATNALESYPAFMRELARRKGAGRLLVERAVKRHLDADPEYRDVLRRIDEDYAIASDEYDIKLAEDGFEPDALEFADYIDRHNGGYFSDAQLLEENYLSEAYDAERAAFRSFEDAEMARFMDENPEWAAKWRRMQELEQEYKDGNRHFSEVATEGERARLQALNDLQFGGGDPIAAARAQREASVLMEKLKGRARKQAAAAKAKYNKAMREEFGLLPDDEVLANVKAGRSYVDPVHGVEAALDPYGQLVWRAPGSRHAGYAHKHWVRDVDFSDAELEEMLQRYQQFKQQPPPSPLRSMPQ